MRSLSTSKLRAVGRTITAAVVAASVAMVAMAAPAGRAVHVLAAPMALCQGNTADQSYNVTDAGVVFLITVEWVLYPDCSHQVNFVSVRGSGYVVQAVDSTFFPGAFYNATLADTSGYEYDESNYNGCFGTHTTYTNYFSGVNHVPATAQPVVRVSFAQPDCQHNVIIYTAHDAVN